MAQLTKIVVSQLKTGFTVGIAAGIIAVILTAILGALPADALSLIVINTVLLVLLIMIAAQTKLKGLSLYNFVILLASIGIVGSIINLILPGVSGFILTAPDFTISGLLMSFIYIGLGLFVLKRLGIDA